MKPTPSPGPEDRWPPPPRRALADERGFVLVFDHRFVFREVRGGVRLTAECPDCLQTVTMVEKQPYRQFVLSWIPLWKVRKGEPCLECPKCKARFDVPEHLRPRPAVVDEDEPEPEGPRF